jgi:hypothetical protein
VRCTFTALGAGQATLDYHATEGIGSDFCPYDCIQIDGTKYCNSHIPPGDKFTILAGEMIYWCTDCNTQYEGSKLCFD